MGVLAHQITAQVLEYQTGQGENNPVANWQQKL
jgi:hypothetical protein